jgi:hypothetical protein
MKYLLVGSFKAAQVLMRILGVVSQKVTRGASFPHPQPFSRREKGDKPLSLRERGRG